ncbi:unnamed protein product [Rotaria sp. Silwood1]|nr:unnamed protein product [Rotaria sp. Silwood1]CAF4647961.1 unnamed protein product [Rotaria sp. Silwood1]
MNRQDENSNLTNSQKIATSLLAGACAGAVAKTTIAPFDRAKINFQVRVNQFSYRLCFKFLRESYVNEGFISWYRGNSANLVRVIPSAAINFAAHEQWKRVLGTDKHEKTPGRRFISGSLAGATSATITYPLDLARARMAVTNKSVYSNLFSVFLSILQNESITALYRGALLSIIGVLPYSGFVFFTYESLKHIRTDYDPHRPINKTERMLFGAIAGLVGQTASYPFDVIRRRLQTAAVIRPDEASLGAIATARKIIREEGIRRGLYKGVTMNWLKGPISVGMIYDFIRIFHTQSFQLLKRSLCRRWQSSSSYDPKDNDLIPPTTCCMSNCANCVWISFAEEIAQRYPHSSMEVIDDILKRYIDDQSFREFLEYEIQARSMGKK